MTNHIKKHLPLIVVLIIFVLTFNVLVFILADNYTSKFWCGYTFVIASWFAMVGVAYMYLKNHDSNSGFLNAPSLLISVAHLGIQLILGLAVMFIPLYSVKASLCIEIIVFTIYLSVLCGLEFYKNKNS